MMQWAGQAWTNHSKDQARVQKGWSGVAAPVPETWVYGIVLYGFCAQCSVAFGVVSRL